MYRLARVFALALLLFSVQALAQTGLNCPPGAFWDAKAMAYSNCYYCPLGYSRTGEEIWSDRACSSSTQLTKMSATFKQSAACGAGQFYDVLDFSPTYGGTCWSCREGTQRTVFPVNSASACTVGVFGPYYLATKHGHQCPTGTFIDPRNGGECWQCPPGSDRTAAPVTASDACSKAALFAKAINVQFSGSDADAVRAPFKMALTGQPSLCLAETPEVNNLDKSPRQVVLRACSDYTAVVWKAGSRNEMEMHGSRYNDCLEIGGSDPNDGAKVKLVSCHYQNNQRWDLTAAGEIKSRMNGKCVDVPYSNAQAGVQLQMYTCNGGAAQRWTPKYP